MQVEQEEQNRSSVHMDKPKDPTRDDVSSKELNAVVRDVRIGNVEAGQEETAADLNDKGKPKKESDVEFQG
jgi:hypothetical protein